MFSGKGQIFWIISAKLWQLLYFHIKVQEPSDSAPLAALPEG